MFLVSPALLGVARELETGDKVVVIQFATCYVIVKVLVELAAEHFQGQQLNMNYKFCKSKPEA